MIPPLMLGGLLIACCIGLIMSTGPGYVAGLPLLGFPLLYLTGIIIMHRRSLDTVRILDDATVELQSSSRTTTLPVTSLLAVRYTKRSGAQLVTTQGVFPLFGCSESACQELISAIRALHPQFVVGRKPFGGVNLYGP